LFLDLLIQSGSSAGIVLLRDLIRTESLDERKAAHLVAAAGSHAQYPSDKLLDIFKVIFVKLWSSSACWALQICFGVKDDRL